MPSVEKATISLNDEQIKLWLQIHKSLNQIAKATKAGKAVTLRMSENGFESELDGTEG
ncbi:hypothetical protein GH880_30345, partial [Bacillus thuringiensis]|nr:hypothetical protein [Bacillus thuringiensis]